MPRSGQACRTLPPRSGGFTVYMPRSGQACRTLPPRSGGFTVWPICCLEGGFPYKTVNPSHAHGAGKGHGGRPLRGKGHNGKPLRGNKTSTAASRSAAMRPPRIHSSSRTPSFATWGAKRLRSERGEASAKRLRFVEGRSIRQLNRPHRKPAASRRVGALHVEYAGVGK